MGEGEHFTCLLNLRLGEQPPYELVIISEGQGQQSLGLGPENEVTFVTSHCLKTDV